MNDQFEQALAQLDVCIDQSAVQIDQMIGSFETALHVLVDRSDGHISHEVSSVIRTLEAAASEAISRGALLDHRAGNHVAARRSIDAMKRLQVMTVDALRRR